MSRRRSAGPPAWGLMLGGGLAAAVGLGFLPSGLANDLAYDCLATAAVAALLAGVRLRRPRPALPWWLLTAGATAFVVGDAVWNAYAVAGAGAPYPGAADAFYLAGYPLLAASAFLLVRLAGGTASRLTALDAAIVVAGAAVPAWALVIEPHAAGTQPLLDRAVLLAYPSMDVLLVAVVARLVLTGAWRNASAALVALAAAGLLAADTVFYGVEGGHSDALWSFSAYEAVYVLWAAAALHPSAAVIPRRLEPRVTGGSLVLLAASSAAAPAVLAWQVATGRKPSLVELGLVGVVALLVLARMAVLARALERAGRVERLARSEAESAQRLLAEQNDRLRELDRAKDELLGVVSHDLRTPATSIAGFASLLRSGEAGELAEEQRAAVEAIERGVGRMVALIDELLAAVRTRRGRLGLEARPLDLAELARACAAALEPQARRAGVRLRAACDAEAAIVGDPARLGQVLDNLVGNALKFTPAGGTVTMRVAPRDDTVVLEVEDTGIGIPAEELGRLFERFYRASSATDRGLPGTGLGLAIAKEILEAHGAEIGVRSGEGSGTTVRVVFPRATADAGAPSALTQAA